VNLVARLDIAPMPALRMTQRSKWRESSRKYLTWKRDVAWLARVANYKLESGDKVVFHMPLPKAAKKQSSPGAPHRVRPDLDNLLKAVFDALHTEDAHIDEISSRKVWSETAAIEFWRAEGR
jgi:Holliday junction resolvase RusA-like endonuclease